jgi:AraC-like DNA-binding protein
VSVSELIEMSGMSASSLRRRFISGLGMTPINYINSVKIENAKSYFESGITKIKDVSRLCGIDDEFYFSRLFSKVVGMSPTEYLKKIKNLYK